MSDKPTAMGSLTIGSSVSEEYFVHYPADGSPPNFNPGVLVNGVPLGDWAERIIGLQKYIQQIEKQGVELRKTVLQLHKRLEAIETKGQPANVGVSLPRGVEGPLVVDPDSYPPRTDFSPAEIYPPEIEATRPKPERDT